MGKKCPFCPLANMPVGHKEADRKKGDRTVPGSRIIDRVGGLGEKTGAFTTLQSNLPGNRIFLMVMPNSHIDSFGGLYAGEGSPALARNYGEAVIRAGYAVEELSRSGILEQIRPLDEGILENGVAVYGKTLTVENTVPHLHTKVLDVSGGMAQSLAPDNGYAQKPVEHSSAEGDYVIAKPCRKVALDAKWMDLLDNELRNKLS